MNGGAVWRANCPFIGKSPPPDFYNLYKEKIACHKFNDISQRINLFRQLENHSSGISSSLWNQIEDFNYYYSTSTYRSKKKKKKKGAKRGRRFEAKKSFTKYLNNIPRGLVLNNLINIGISECKKSSPLKFNLPRFFYTNPTSLSEAKLDIFEGLLVDHDLGLFCETWWKNDQVKNIPHFNTFARNRNYTDSKGRIKKGGGLAIFLRDTFRGRIYNPNVKVDERIEFLVISVKPDLLPYSLSNIIIILIYIPPQYVTELSQELNEFLSNVVTNVKTKFSKPGIFLFGDFNRWDYGQFVETSKLDLVVRFPTFFNSRSHSMSNLDLIFTNLKSYYCEPVPLPCQRNGKK